MAQLRFEDLHPTVREFAEAAKAADYIVDLGSMQVMISRPGEKLGGWNTQKEHWYVSKRAAQGSDELLERHGFRWMENGSSGHQWWQIDGVDKVSAFRSVVAKLTGVPIP